jgi:hypothetical protein
MVRGNSETPVGVNEGWAAKNNLAEIRSQYF